MGHARCEHWLLLRCNLFIDEETIERPPKTPRFPRLVSRKPGIQTLFHPPLLGIKILEKDQRSLLSSVSMEIFIKNGDMGWQDGKERNGPEVAILEKSPK